MTEPRLNHTSPATVSEKKLPWQVSRRKSKLQPKPKVVCLKLLWILRDYYAYRRDEGAPLWTVVNVVV